MASNGPKGGVVVYVVLADGGDSGDIPSGAGADIGEVELLGVYDAYEDAAARVYEAAEAAVSEFGEEDADEIGGTELLADMRDTTATTTERLQAAEELYALLVGEEMGSIGVFEQTVRGKAGGHA